MQEDLQSQNSWKIEHEHIVYDNPWIKLHHFDVINPAGNPGIYGKVHFKNVAIGIVPLDEEGNTWLVGQYRFTLNSYSWEIPEGGGPLNEDPLNAAKRELLEETGLKADHWEEILRMYLSNSVTDEYSIIYIATGLTQHHAAPEETEQLTIKQIPFPVAAEMVSKGLITDAVSVAAILKVKLMIEQGIIKFNV